MPTNELLSQDLETSPLTFMRHRQQEGIWHQATNLISYSDIAQQTSTSKDTEILIRDFGIPFYNESCPEKNGACCGVYLVHQKVGISLAQIIDREVHFYQHNYTGGSPGPKAFLHQEEGLSIIGLPAYLSAQSVAMLPIILHELGHIIGHQLDPDSTDKHEIALGERSAWHQAHKLYRQLKKLGFPVGEICSETDFEKIKLCALRSHAQSHSNGKDFPAPFIKGIRAKILPGFMV